VDSTGSIERPPGTGRKRRLVRTAKASAEHLRRVRRYGSVRAALVDPWLRQRRMVKRILRLSLRGTSAEQRADRGRACAQRVRRRRLVRPLAAPHLT